MTGLALMVALSQAPATEQVQLKGRSGQLSVEADLFRTVAADGRVTVTLAVYFGSRANPAATVRTTSVYGSDGVPQSKQFRMDSPAAQASKTVEFRGGTAVVNPGQLNEKKYEAPADVSLANASLFWFWKSTPAEGAAVSYADFDPDTEKWSVNRVSYRGKDDIGHHLVHGERNAWVDDRGLLVRLQDISILLERAK